MKLSITIDETILSDNNMSRADLVDELNHLVQPIAEDGEYWQDDGRQNPIKTIEVIG